MHRRLQTIARDGSHKMAGWKEKYAIVSAELYGKCDGIEFRMWVNQLCFSCKAGE